MGAFLVAVGVLVAALSSHAQITGTLTVLRSFNGPSGEQPDHALTLGSDGNFYGTTPAGGANGFGEVFRVTPAGAVTVLHSFAGFSVDGQNPECKLVLASDGNFYGTTSTGGPSTSGASGTGTVFQITPAGTFTTLHAFYNNDLARGAQPSAGLVQGTDGFLYGTTTQGGGGGRGGGNGDGTIFKISLDGVFTSLHAFDFHMTGTGGYSPKSVLVQGDDGFFYGVASGGDNGVGVIYKVSTGGTLTNLYSFNVRDGSGPAGDLIKDGSEVFYGVTLAGGQAGNSGRGTIFKITSAGVLTTVHNFGPDNPNVVAPLNLLLARDGNFYGVSASGGLGYAGSILQCTPAGAVTDIFDFNSNNGTDDPIGGLVQASDGSFFGTTAAGGASSYGTIFQVVVTPHPPFFNRETDLSNSVEYLAFATGRYFGYFSYLTDPHYLYHFDLGYEYVFNASDSHDGVYLYDFTSSDFFYTSPSFPFPYLYDFNLRTVLYYYPDPSHTGHYNTKGTRYFYNFATGKIISK